MRVKGNVNVELCSSVSANKPTEKMISHYVIKVIKILLTDYNRQTDAKIIRSGVCIGNEMVGQAEASIFIEKCVREGCVNCVRRRRFVRGVD